MRIKEEKVNKLIDKLDEILRKMDQEEELHYNVTSEIEVNHKKSAQNLVHYMAFRSFDVREIQKHLKNLGLTRFANAEGHIKASVLTIRNLLSLAVSRNRSDFLDNHWTIKKGKKLLNKNTRNLLGKSSRNRRVRIMVTQPTESATDYEMVKAMVAQGMDCARINCAHDSPEIWGQIISNVKKAALELNKEVKIAMDLAGPKIRTGKIFPGPKVIRYKPQKDDFGKVVTPKVMFLIPEDGLPATQDTLRIRGGSLEQLEEGMVLSLVDARSKNRKLKVVRVAENKVTVETKKSIYLEPGLVLSTGSEKPIELRIGEIDSKENALQLKINDELWLYKDERIGAPAIYDSKGVVKEPAKVSCQKPEVFDYVKVGDRIFFDDGKIGSEIIEIHEEFLRLKVFLAQENGSKLKAEKGINFPDTTLGFSGLTTKDKIDLKFVVEHADIVNFSFVNRREDIVELKEELSKLECLNKIAVVLKIETKAGFQNLVPIVLEAMKFKSIGVMIARGDLAIETGWEHIGQVQQEMLSIAGSAHIPVIWATQVLENLAKKGLPSRSEITDATTALKAECVMLNKGPYILDAITLLDAILCSMESTQHKNESMLPKLQNLTGEYTKSNF